MELIEVKTAELTGKALDWAVGVAVGKKMVVRRPTGQVNGELMVWEEIGDLGGLSWFSPSTNWMHAGPLIEERIGALSGPTSVRSYSIACAKGKTLPISGDTLLMAVCRAIVCEFIGDLVRVPAELVSEKT